MKGIREAAMGLPEEQPTPKYESGKGYQSKLFDADRYDGSWNDPQYQDGYVAPKYKKYFEKKEQVKGVLNITIEIFNTEIGPFADFNNENTYDTEKATTKATEIAYDYIEKLAGKGFDSRYKVEFDITESYESFDASITLTPII